MGNNGSESKLAVAGSLGLILTIAGVVLTQQQLKSSRPLEEPNVMKESVREKTVPARLWEDPLEAVEHDKEKGSRKEDPAYQPEALKPVRDKLRKKQQEGKDRIDREDKAAGVKSGRKSWTDILIVRTEGGPNAEGKEERLRDRYAITSALGVACYVPEAEEHLSYVKWRVGGKDRPIPYEWYRARKTRQCSNGVDRVNAVLVLWVTDEIVNDSPLSQLEHIIGSLLYEEPNRLAKSPSKQSGLSQLSRVKVIGPRSSSEYRSWLEEASSSPPAWPTYDGKIDLYSAWATAMPSLLISQLKGKPGENPTSCQFPEKCAERLKKVLEDAKIYLKYSIESDDQLLMALVEELERRRVKFEQDAVVLIGEWDTYYGRALPIEFRAAVCARVAGLPVNYGPLESDGEKKDKRDKRQRIKEACPTLEQAIDLQVNNQKVYEDLNLNVWRYSYLRGLDGQVPGEKKENLSSKKERDNGDGKKGRLWDIQFLERPVGPSQLDYMRRLADRIEQEIVKGNNKIRAVGILGTDPYDTLLILQVLRERFPTTIFFVTDLDARLVYPEEYSWTRNLLIASHYGLALNGELQRDVPPFRSSYQTSAFFAVLQAVGHVRVPEFCDQKTLHGTCGYAANLSSNLFDDTEKPRLYEVGRHGAVDLSVGIPQYGYESLHPGRLDLKEGLQDSHRPSVALVGARLALLSLIITAGMFAYRGTRQGIQKSPIIGMTVVLIPTVLTVDCLFLEGRLLSQVGNLSPVESLIDSLVSWHDQGEPFYWFEGVSIWPTEIIRLAAVFLTVGLLVKGYVDLSINRKEVEAQFAFTPFSPRGHGWDRVRKSWLTVTGWNRRKEAWLVVLGIPNRDAQEKLNYSWNLYLEADSMTVVVLRVWLIVFFLKQLVPLVLDALGNPDWWVPCRGEFSCSWDSTIVLYLLIPAAMVLTAFVLDQAMLCWRWITVLSSAKGGWPHPTTDQESCLDKVRLVAKRTEVVSRIIAYPPLVWLLIIIARNNYFDHWSFPPQLIAAWSINLIAAFAPALLLYWAAERMRGEVLEQLKQDLHRQLRWGESASSDVAHTREAIKDVESIRKGAFLPLWQQPLVQTLLYGVVALLQYLYLGT